MWRMWSVRRWLAPLTVLVALAGASPALAQFTDSYNFLKAVREKDSRKAIEILDKPGSTIVNTRDADSGETALHIAVKRSDIAWVGFVLQKGGNVNAREREGNTALMLASQARWAEGVQLLVQVRAQVDVQNRLGETALQMAVRNRDSTIAKLLLDAGASPDVNDSTGVSARALAESDPRAAAVARLFKDVPVRKARPVQGPTI